MIHSLGSIHNGMWFLVQFSSMMKILSGEWAEYHTFRIIMVIYNSINSLLSVLFYFKQQD